MGDDDTLFNGGGPADNMGFWPGSDVSSTSGSDGWLSNGNTSGGWSASPGFGMSDSFTRRIPYSPDVLQMESVTSSDGAGAPVGTAWGSDSSVYSGSGTSDSSPPSDPLEPSNNTFVRLFEAAAPQDTLTGALLAGGASAGSGQGRSGEAFINSYESRLDQQSEMDGDTSPSPFITDVKNKQPKADDAPPGGGPGTANPSAPAENNGQQGPPAAEDKFKMRPDLGESVKEFESDKRGVGTVSSGVGDAGGVSYGTYQLNSQNGAGTVKAFLDSEDGKKYASEFAGLKPGSPEFTAKWKEIAERDPDGLHQAEKGYLYRTHYLPRAQQAAGLGFDMNNPAVQDAVWSGAVQHGRYGLVLKAAANDPNLKNMCGDVDDQLRVLYHYRGLYAQENGVSRKAGVDRYARELPVLRNANRAFQGGSDR
jgi:hypothetical protein